MSTGRNGKLLPFVSEPSVSPGRGLVRGRNVRDRSPNLVDDSNDAPLMRQSSMVPECVSTFFFKNVLDFKEIMADGFYDVKNKGNGMPPPSLNDLRDFDYTSDIGEVILIDRARDQVLCDFIERVVDTVNKTEDNGSPPTFHTRVARLACEVSRRLGGEMRTNLDENCKIDVNSVVFKLRSLFLADELHIPSRLERGVGYAEASGISEHVWNCVSIIDGDTNTQGLVAVKGEGEGLGVVDLLYEPGAIYRQDSIAAINYHRFEQTPADWASGKSVELGEEWDEGNESDGSGDVGNNAFGVQLDLENLIDNQEVISIDDLELGRMIGRGSFGEVYKGKWRGTDVAIKKLFPAELDLSALRSEISLLRQLRHPNILMYMGACMDPQLVSIITEFMARGDLYRLLHRKKPAHTLTPKRRIAIAIDIAKGLHFLHSSTPPIIHRDLKSPNILIDKYWRVVLSDFGLSRVRAETYVRTAAAAGSPAWMSPEVLRGEPFDEKADIYSFGVILYEIFTGMAPYDGIHPMQIVGMVGFSNHRLGLPDSLNPHIDQLIEECWNDDPKKRPCSNELVDRLVSIEF